MKVARNMRWVYIAWVIPSSTASYHNDHRTNVNPVSHSIELAYSPFMNRFATRATVYVDDTQIVARTLLAFLSTF